jgi:hypothetical protein
MKVERFKPNKSSFLSVEKDLSIITKEMFKNPRLQKLLFYETTDALKKPNLTDEQALSLFGKNIKIVPKLSVDGKCLNYLIVSFDNFTPNGSNPEFRDNIIEFDIICHFDQWTLSDFQLRPYRIAAEIDSLFDEKHLTGIGTLNFLGCNQIVLTDEFAGLCLMYTATHGEEDKNAYTPEVDNQIHFQDLLAELTMEGSLN